MTYLLIWLALSVPVALIVGQAIHIMGADETVPPAPLRVVPRR
jgi:hypothetical protein